MQVIPLFTFQSKPTAAKSVYHSTHTLLLYINGNIISLFHKAKTSLTYFIFMHAVNIK